MLKELEKKARGIQGAVIEDNRFCISVHYRHVQESVTHQHITPRIWFSSFFVSIFSVFETRYELVHVCVQDYGLLHERVQSVLGKYPHFHLTRGKKVMEIRPSIKWNKGHALEYLLDTLGFTGMDNVLPVYIGDDRTDEDAFKVSQIGFAF